MTEGLKQLSDQAEKEHQDEEERKAKRPRETKGEGGSTLPSMQPFGVPDQR